MPACLVVKLHCGNVTHILSFIWNQLKSDLIIHSTQLPSNINIVQLIFILKYNHANGYTRLLNTEVFTVTNL